MIMELEERLKPCPLCGSNALIVEVSFSPDEIFTHIQCSCCELELRHTQYRREVRDIRSRVIKTFNVNEDAITIWNKRVNEHEG